MNKLPYAFCQACPLQAEKYTSVPGAGNATDPVLILVGEGPGREEARKGVPFIGESGKLVAWLLKMIGLDRGDVWIANTTACWPQGLEGKEKDAAVETAAQMCRGRLKAELEKLPPGVPVLALGAVAQKALGLEMRDHWETENLTGRKALATYHPAYALYDAGSFIKIVAAFRKARTASPKPVPMDWTILRTLPDLDKLEWLRSLGDDDLVCMDVETNSSQWYAEDKLLWVGLSKPRYPGEDPRKVGTEGILLPTTLLYTAEGKEWFQRLMVAIGCRVGGHNFKFDGVFVEAHLGVHLPTGWDTILMVKNIHEHWLKGLKDLATYYYNVDDYEYRYIGRHFKSKNKATWDYGLVPEPSITTYLANDIHWNLLLGYQLRDQLKAVGRWEAPYLSFELPASEELAQVELRGVAVDRDRAQGAKTELTGISLRLKEEMEDLTDGVVKNPRSYKQIAHYLYDVEGIKPPVIYKKGPRTTCDQALDEIGDSHPLVKLLREYRRVDKLHTSYVEPLLTLSRKDKHGVWRVFPNYLLYHVVTGRLSARKPAVQTIPRPDDPLYLRRDGEPYGKMIKDLYVAPPGYVLVAVDGSQWELRVGAAWSQDPFLVKLYQDGKDFHNEMCDILFTPGGWDRELRTKEKNFIFGWWYGGTLMSAASVFEIPYDAKVRAADRLEHTLTRMVTWRRELFEMARTKGVIVSPLGRAFHFSLVTDRNVRQVQKEAINYPVQGTASEITSIAGFKAGPVLRAQGIYPVLYKHDEIVLEVPEDKIDLAARVQREAFEEAGHSVFPIIPWVANAEMGNRWGTMTKL